MVKQQISYKTLIPKHLHLQVEKLLDYLTYYPFEKPTECHHCGSVRFHLEPGNSSRIDKSIASYFCLNCKHRFNQLTNSIFMFSRLLPLWGELGKLYLAGLPSQKIADQLQITVQSVHSYRKKIDAYMLEQYPELFNWWISHQHQVDLTLTNKVKKQKQAFLQWLDTLINRKDYHCPHCKGPLYRADYKKTHQIQRPYFVCYRCHYYFNALSGTVFENMTYIEIWSEYAKKLIEGYSNKQIQEMFKIGRGTASKWRRLFKQQMIELSFNELVQWSKWQRTQRHSNIIRKMHEKSINLAVSNNQC